MSNSERAKIANRTPAPTGQCVAIACWGNQWGKRYRGADHMRCTHPTPLPAGYHRCEGDNGCPFRLTRGRFCWYHNDHHDDLSDRDRAAIRAEWGGPKQLASNQWMG